MRDIKTVMRFLSYLDSRYICLCDDEYEHDKCSLKENEIAKLVLEFATQDE